MQNNNLVPQRVLYAQQIVNQMMLNPDAASLFVCTVANEVSMIEFERIYGMYCRNLKTIHKTTNLTN